MAYVEILIAAFAAFMLGFAWYTALFGKAWQAETGVTDEQAQSGMAITHGLAFLMMCIIGLYMNRIAGYHTGAEDETFLHGAFHGLMTACYIALPAVAIHYAYQKKSLKLFLIDGGYIAAFFSLMTGILFALNL